MATAPEYSAIPDPTIDPASIHETVVALKHTVEVLTGLRGTGNYAVVTKAGLVAQQNLAGVDPATSLKNLGISSLSGDLTTLTATVTALSATVNALTAAWADYTPSFVSIVGTITSKTATGRFLQVGKTVYFSMILTVTTNGTGATGFTVGLPVAAKASVAAVGREMVINGKEASVSVNSAGATTVAVVNYDTTYPGANGTVHVINGVYEAA